MEVISLIRWLKDNDIELSLSGSDIEISYSGESISSEILEKIKENKDAIVAFFKKIDNEDIIPQLPLQSSYVLSSSQRRLWILSQFEEGNVAYNIPGIYIFSGDLDFASFEYSFGSLIARHEILRTVIREDETSEIRQVVNTPESSGFRVEYLDLRGKASEEDVRSLVQQEMVYEFDLSMGPLLRAVLYHVEGKKWVFSLVMHHIISDGWSREILIKELFSFYNSRLEGTRVALPPLRIQYKDYASWQQEQLTGGALSQSKVYWLTQFSGDLPLLELPLDKPRPGVKTYNGSIIKRRIGNGLSQGLKAVSQGHGSTLFMGLVAVVKTLLYRYTGQTDIIVGSPIAGRGHIELEDQIGFYVNTLALRTHFSGSDSFESLLVKVREVTLGAYQRDMSRNPLFDVEIVLQNTEQGAHNSIEGLQISTYEAAESVVSKFDLSFYFAPVGNDLEFYIEYNNDLFSEESINSLAEHLIHLMGAVIESPSAVIASLDYLSISEKEQMLVDYTATDTDYPGGSTIIELFEAQVEQTPENIAVECKEVSLSYKELNNRANQLAHYFQNKGIGSQCKVVFILNRSSDYLASMLAVWKIGACFIPLDPDAPFSRNSQIINQLDYSCILTNENLRETQREFDQTDRLVFIQEALRENVGNKNPNVRVSPSDLSYIIFTSGSTGAPKGAMVEHLGMLNHLYAKINDFKITSKDNVAQTATQVFDVSVWQFTVALLAGGKTTVLTGENAWSPERLLENINIHGITLLESVPAHFSLLLDHFSKATEQLPLPTLRYLIMNGEALPVDYCKEWFKYYKSIPMANVYGPTECSDDVTHFLVESCSSEWVTYVPIGKPIQNTKLYVLDEELNLTPPGKVGELYVSGPCVGRGYINNDTQTATSFLPNKYAGTGGANFSRLYKTGDLVKWLPGGILSFIGRKDEQIKIRGNRIELGEIESALQANSHVKQVVVLYHKSVANGVLAAYLVTEEGYEKSELIASLKLQLPYHMIPDTFIEIESIPLTVNGKINKKALPPPEISSLQKQEFVGPRNPMEAQLVNIWENVLNVQRVGIHDNFFDLGGHSLLVIQVTSEIRKELHVELPVAIVFQYSTVAELRGYIDIMSPLDEGLDFDIFNL